MKKNNTKQEIETPREVLEFFSMVKENVPHGDKASLRTLLSKLSVTQEAVSRYEDGTGKYISSPFTSLLKGFGRTVRSPWMISGVGIATMFIVFVTSGVVTTNKDITRLADKSYSLKDDIVFTTSSSLTETDILFITNEIISYSDYLPEEDTKSGEIVMIADKEVAEVIKTNYEI